MASRHAKSRLPSWLAWLGIGDLVLVAIVGVLSFYYEDFKEDFPRLIIWQLTTYQWIINDSNLHKSSVHWVTPVEIDDRTFYGYLGNQTRDDFTDREFLARLVRKATESCAKVIALDINFDTSSIDNKTPLTTGNDSLLQAIREAYGNGVPVVLVFGFTKGKQVIPNLFEDEPIAGGRGISYEFPEEESPSRKGTVPRFGFDSAGDDFRKVPLATTGKDDQGHHFEFYSFALQTVDAYEQVNPAPSSEKKVLKDKLKDKLSNHEFVYTTFLPAEAFNRPKLNGPISAADLVCGQDPKGKRWDKCHEQNAEDLLRDRIVLIGGNRHAYKGEEGDQGYIDNYPSPVGDLRGMYLQANYIEGLLDNRVLYEVNRWLAAVIDVVLAIIMLGIISRAHKIWKQPLILLILFIPIVATYVAATNLHYCFDFMFPLMLLFLHPAIESYIRLIPGLHPKEGAHEKAAHKRTLARRHSHVVRQRDRRVTSLRPGDGGPEPEQLAEEVVHESKEAGIDDKGEGQG